MINVYKRCVRVCVKSVCEGMCEISVWQGTGEDKTVLEK